MRAFDEQLPDVLMTMSGSLKVGQSFDHSLQAIVDDGNAPASEEFERVLARRELGRPMDEALAAMADRIDSDDLRFVLMSVTIQRRDRRQPRRSLPDGLGHRARATAVPAQGAGTDGDGARVRRTSCSRLPFVTAALIAVINPGYLTPLFTTGTVSMLRRRDARDDGRSAAFILKKIVTIKG